MTAGLYLLGGWDIALKALVAFIVLDYVTGIMKAAQQRKLNSEIGLNGAIKKIGMLMLVDVAVIMDKLADAHGVLRNLCIYYLVANEGLSIIENLGAIGIIVPEGVKKRLEQLREENA